jgi:hypothetical protein
VFFLGADQCCDKCVCVYDVGRLPPWRVKRSEQSPLPGFVHYTGGSMLCLHYGTTGLCFTELIMFLVLHGCWCVVFEPEEHYFDPMFNTHACVHKHSVYACTCMFQIAHTDEHTNAHALVFVGCVRTHIHTYKHKFESACAYMHVNLCDVKLSPGAVWTSITLKTIHNHSP